VLDLNILASVFLIPRGESLEIERQADLSLFIIIPIRPGLKEQERISF